ncbi:hypothetical protein ACSQ67_014946 [Phaseolus vulgaris]
MVGQQSPDFGIGLSLAVERVTGCILEESIENRLCYGSCKEASMNMVGRQLLKAVSVVNREMGSVVFQFVSVVSLQFVQGYGLWHDSVQFYELLYLLSLFDL